MFVSVAAAVIGFDCCNYCYWLIVVTIVAFAIIGWILLLFSCNLSLIVTAIVAAVTHWLSLMLLLWLQLFVDCHWYCCYGCGHLLIITDITAIATTTFTGWFVIFIHTFYSLILLVVANTILAAAVILLIIADTYIVAAVDVFLFSHFISSFFACGHWCFSMVSLIHCTFGSNCGTLFTF